MNHPQGFYNILFVINELGSTILKKISDYENVIQNDYSLKKKFHNIEFVYIHSIILDIAKLTSKASSDKSGLKDLKKFCSDKTIQNKITNFEVKYKNTLEKIKNNRNRIIAHVDISEENSYFKMGFSDIEIKTKKDDYKKYMELTNQQLDIVKIEELEKFQTSSIKEERYSPSDFLLEIGLLKEMINEVLVIASDINLYFYNSKSTL